VTPDVDVCIVGAGLTGLWAAYWLRQSLPDASVLVVEANRVGFGASGRNGGWLSGKMVGLRRHLANGPAGRNGVVDFQRAIFEAIGEVLGVMADHKIDVDAVRGGYLQIARTPAELGRVKAAIATDHQWGLTVSDVDFLSAEQFQERIHVPGVLGASFSPHSARFNPAKLVSGLARIVEKAGVRIVEQTTATELAPGLVRTTQGRVRARIVLRATEGYTPRLPGHRRDVLPMNSSMIVTEPLSEADWAQIGWTACEGLSGAQHTYFYSQRTADGRIAIGGRGLPYRFGSRVDQDGQLDRVTLSQLERLVAGLFPSAKLTTAHAWCGVLGVPRDWSPSVTYDQATGCGHAGGYAGQGVTAAYLAGRTLADLVAERQTRYTALPWTNRSVRTWEPEPAGGSALTPCMGCTVLLTRSRQPAARTTRPRSPAWPMPSLAVIDGHATPS
jgi:glycine/D-amino acid oxidase-like deaminating enzyme